MRMAIVKEDLVEFDMLKSGEVFTYSGEEYIVLDRGYVESCCEQMIDEVANAVRLCDGSIGIFEPDDLVKPVNAKLTISK